MPRSSCSRRSRRSDVPPNRRGSAFPRLVVAALSAIVIVVACSRSDPPSPTSPGRPTEAAKSPFTATVFVPTGGLVNSVATSPSVSPTTTSAARPTPIRSLPPSPADVASDIPHLDLEVTAGFWSEGGRTHYAVVLRNPNEDLAPQDPVEVRLDFYNGADLVTSRVGRIGAFRLTPGSSFGSLGVIGSISASRVDAVVKSTNWRVPTDIDSREFEAERVRSKQRSDGRYVTTGHLTTPPFGRPEGPFVRVVAIYFNSQNEIVGGNDDVSFHFGGAAAFEIVSSPISDVASTRAFWSWGVASGF